MERGLRRGEGGDFAVHQRGDPRRGCHRRLAVGGGRIASQTRNPVYPGEKG
jgi:hypothetical protein